MTAQEAAAPGFSRADLHVHTTYSDGIAAPEDVLNFYALHSGCRVFAITDHDTIDGALYAQAFAARHPYVFGSLEVIVGEEVTTRDGHVLGLFLREWVPPGLTAEETIRRIHAQDGLAVAAHPYTRLMRFAGLVGVGDLARTLPFDAIETRNSNFTEYFSNRRAERSAEGKARVGGSDAHFLSVVARCYTEFPGATAADLRAAIAARTTRPRGSCYGAFTLAGYVLDRLRTGGSLLPRRRDSVRTFDAGSLEIRVHQESSFDVAVIAPAGRIVEATMGGLKETLTLLTGSRIGVVVDMSGVDFMDSAGVTGLVSGLKAARQNGVGLCLADLSAASRRTLTIARLLSAIPNRPTVGESRREVASARTRAAQETAERGMT